jgi:hypothetical protein
MRYFLCIAMVMLIATVAGAQWQPAIRLTYDTACSVTCANNARAIDVRADSLHVVWRDMRDGSFEIYYKRSTDGGSTWGSDTRISEPGDTSASGSVAVSGEYVHVVWADFRFEDSEIYCRSSSDGGDTWGAEQRLTNAPGASITPAVAASGSEVHLVWTDFRDGNNEIYYMRSTDNGATWSPEVRLTNAAGSSYNQSITVSGPIVNVIWNDARDGSGNLTEIYQKRSTDGGRTWGEDRRLTNDPAASNLPTSYISANLLHVVFADNRSGAYDLYYLRSTDRGETWEPERRLTDDPAFSSWPSVAAVGAYIYLAWIDGRTGLNELYYKRSLDGGTTWDDDMRIVEVSSAPERPSLGAFQSSVHLVWSDAHDGNSEIYYMHDPRGYAATVPGLSPVADRADVVMVYPNPVAQSAVVEYTVATRTRVSIALVDITGGRVATLLDAAMREPGKHAEPITLPDDIAPGSYTLVLSTTYDRLGARIMR